EFARSLMPTDPHVYNELGVVAYHKHSYEEACELLQRAISLSSDPEETLHVNLGHALLQCGLHARALEAFRAGLRLQPQSRGALSGVAFALQLQ
ncbi:APC6, partial [Symbiodinium sp. KB8]